MRKVWLMRNTFLCVALLGLAGSANALELTLTGPTGQPLPLAMVTLKAERPLRAAGSDNGYPPERSEQRISEEITAFSCTDGRLKVDYPEAVPLNLRGRAPGYQDLNQSGVAADAQLSLSLTVETDPAALAAQHPANPWAP